jgi:hypothetical protein
MAACPIADVVLELAFIVLAVGEQNFDLAIHDPPSVEATLYDFVGVAEHNTDALGSSISPLAFVNCAVCELADADSVSFVVLEIAFVLLAVRVDQLAHAVLQTLAHRSVVDLAGNLFHFLDCIVQKRVPAVRDSRFDYSGYRECSGCLFKLSLQDALLSHRPDKLLIFIIDQLFELGLGRLEFHG